MPEVSQTVLDVTNAELKGLRNEIERLKAALREIANMDDPAISAQQVAADALERE